VCVDLDSGDLERRRTLHPMCDTVVTVAPGVVRFAKNSDRDANEAQLLDWQPRGVHPPGSTVRCTWIDIPQAPETHAVLLSRPYWMWGAEMGANEHGVVIGNEAVFTTQPYAATGLTGMDLVRLALERATTATEAVEVITELLAAHGQGGGCGHEHRRFTYHSSFLVADPTGAVVLETAGRLWQVEQVTPGARSISNGLTIEPFASRHSDRLKTRVSACRLRQPRTQQLATDAGGVADLFGLLRDHGGSAGPRYAALNGGMAAPCMHAGGLAAASQTTASWVSELRPDGIRHWVTATAAPCTSIFKPVRVTEPLDLGPQPHDRFDPRTLWWRHEVLHRAVLRGPGLMPVALACARDATEAAWLADPPDPAAAFEAADRLLSAWTDQLLADGPAEDGRPWFVRRYWAARDRRARIN
jgi:secernin